MTLTSSIALFTPILVFKCKHFILKLCSACKCTIENVCEWLVRDDRHSFSVLACLFFGNSKPSYFMLYIFIKSLKKFCITALNYLLHFMSIVQKSAFITNFAKLSIGVSWTITSGRTFKVSACSSIITYVA